MNKILLDTTKYNFDDIISWLVSNMPKTESNWDRWTFVDEENLRISRIDGTLVAMTVPYIIFKDDKDAFIFGIRWA